MTDELKLPTDPDAQRCLKCGKDALDTGWECTECGYDNMPWYRPQVAQQPAAVDDLNAWRAAFVEERATRYREGGMAIEQARIHAETDATLMELAARQPQGGES